MKSTREMIYDSFVEMQKKSGCLGVILLLILVLAFAFGLLCLEGFVVMLLWNYVIANPMGWQQISFWWTTGAIFLFQLIVSIIKSAFRS